MKCIIIYQTNNRELSTYRCKQLFISTPNAIPNIFCLFALFFFSHGVVSLFSIYEFEYPSGIFRPSFIHYINLKKKWINLQLEHWHKQYAVKAS